MNPVLSKFRSKGHRLFSYIDSFFEEANKTRPDNPANKNDTVRSGADFRGLFERLGLQIHPDESGLQRFDPPGDTVNSSRNYQIRVRAVIGEAQEGV